jgi:hypothetical protein
MIVMFVMRLTPNHLVKNIIEDIIGRIETMERLFFSIWISQRRGSREAAALYR